MATMRGQSWPMILFMVFWGPIGVATAQDRVRGQIGAAVTWNQFPDNSGPGSQQTFLDLGWTLSAARSLTDRLSVAGEVGVSANLLTSEVTHRQESNNVYSALIGPRFTTPVFHVDGRSPLDFRVFAQLLGGAQTSDSYPGGRAIQPGVGIDIKTKRGFNFRSEWDHTFVRGQPAISQSRWLTGVVVELRD